MRNILKFLFILGLLLTGKVEAQETEKVNPDVKEIIIVFKTHFDNGYTDKAESVSDKYSTTMMEQALATLERSRSLPKDKQFVWTIPAWPLTQVLQRCTPEMKPKVEAAIREGWFVYHALPVTFETEAGDPELLVRSLTWAADLSRKYNLPLPMDAKLTDVPSHSWFLPTLLTNAGVKILHIGCNPVSSSPDVPLIFWWKGPDGSRLMTIYWGKSYGTSLVPDKDWKFKTWLAIVHTNDNQGPPSPEDVEITLKKAHELAPNAKVRIGRISDFYDAIMKENPELPVVQGDMPDTWIHGYLSMPREMKSVRRLQKEIFSAEQLNTLSNLWSDKKVDISPFTKKASEGALLWDEHTFGMAMSHGTSGEWVYGDKFLEERANGTFKELEASWKEKADRVYQAEKVMDPAYERELRRLASLVKVEGEKVVVYNSLPWIRSGEVTVLHQSDIKALKNIQSGEILPVHNHGNVLKFIAKDIPASGYTTFIPVKDASFPGKIGLAKDEKNNLIENQFFKVQVDPLKGCVSSVTDKSTGVEMVDQSSEYGFGQYLYERFSRKNTTDYVDQYIKLRLWWGIAEFGRPNLDDTPYHRISGEKARVIYTADSVSVKATLIFDQPQHYSLTYTLYQNLPYIELNWHIEGKPADPWPEAGWICFPFNVSNPSFKVGRLGGIIDPSKDIVKGSDFDYYLINSGVAILNSQKNGYAMSTPEAPAISIGSPGLWRYTGKYTSREPKVFVNLFNNQWSTNFTEWVEGSWSAKMYVWSINDFKNEPALVTPSEEFGTPLKAILTEGGGGALPVSRAGIQLSRKGIVISSFGENPFGTGIILRLWEQSGNSGLCKVTLPQGTTFGKAIPVNLRGEKLENPLVIKDNSFETLISAYQPVTFILEQ